MATERNRTPAESSGLTPLDEERARSMADEGGASAAAVEANPEAWIPGGFPQRSPKRPVVN